MVTFFLCWAPFHAQRLLYVYGRQWTHFYIVNEWLYYVAGCFYYFSSTVNPVLYNIMSVNYRNAFCATFCGHQDREYHSSFRESYVEGRWQRTLTWRNPNKVTLTNTCLAYQVTLYLCRTYTSFLYDLFTLKV